MSRRRHAAHAEEHENHERWLITYADMITLLMAFFVMMYGMSILDLKKFADFKAGAAKQLGKSPALSGGQGILFAGTGIADAATAPITGTGPRDGASDAVQATGEVTHENIGQLVTEVRRRLDEQGLPPDTVEANVDPRGAVLRFSDKVLFESGSASLSHEGLQVLDQIALTLAHVDNLVVVEGHTDNVPTGNPGFTNWELSTGRATSVLRWLVQGRRLPAPRFSAAGYAETHPRFLNDTSEHRALNRRVEIIVLAADGPGTTHQPAGDVAQDIGGDIAGDVAEKISEATPGSAQRSTNPADHETTSATTAHQGADAHGEEEH